MAGHSGARVVSEGAPPWRWLVVRTKPRRERVAVTGLTHRGFEAYCPMYLEPAWHRRAPTGPSPLFPGYVFIRCAPLMELNAVRFCPGVLDLVTFDRRLATVGHELIDELRSREGDRGFVVPAEVSDGIPRGRRVRVMSGPLHGMEGIFQCYARGRDRARVLVQYLRLVTAVEVDSGALQMVRDRWSRR